MSQVINSLSKRFVINVMNGETETKTVALLSGIFDGAYNAEGKFDPVNAKYLKEAGFNVDFICMEGGLTNAKVPFKSMSSKRTIKQFRDFIRLNPQRVRKLIIQANNSDVFNSEIEFLNYTPLAGVAPENMGLNEFYSRFQTADGKIEINFDDDAGGVFLTANTIMLFALGAGREATFTFIF